MFRGRAPGSCTPPCLHYSALTLSLHPLQSCFTAPVSTAKSLVLPVCAICMALSYAMRPTSPSLIYLTFIHYSHQSKQVLAPYCELGHAVRAPFPALLNITAMCLVSLLCHTRLCCAIHPSFLPILWVHLLKGFSPRPAYFSCSGDGASSADSPVTITRFGASVSLSGSSELSCS